MPLPSSSSKPHLSPNPSPAPSLLCKHSPSATLDILILLLVLFSASFLLTSYLSYIFNSLSLLLHHYNISLPLPSYSLSFSLFFLISIFFFFSLCNPRSRRCQNPACKGLKKALEFDLQLQSEDLVKSKRKDGDLIEKLPWKGGFEGNPDYECLRAELRKMAPVNGRAVLLFRAKCGCPVAKLEGWGPKKARRHKKALANVSANGSDHR